MMVKRTTPSGGECPAAPKSVAASGDLHPARQCDASEIPEPTHVELALLDDGILKSVRALGRFSSEEKHL